VARFQELGGTVVTAGSDAHAASQFAFGLARAYEIAAAAGFEELAIRRAPGAPRVVERVAIPERLRGPWMEAAWEAGAPGAGRPTTPP
jgi:hypothetical protein